MPHIEAELKEVPAGRVKFGSEWFRRVVRRIEYVKPVQKSENPVITVTALPQGGGHVIDLNVTSALAVNLTPISQYTFTTVTLNVCSGNTTVSLSVFSAVSITTVTCLTTDDARAGLRLLAVPAAAAAAS